MSQHKNKYLIFPGYTYILEYEGFKKEVQGEDILAMFNKGFITDMYLEGIEEETDHNGN